MGNVYNREFQDLEARTKAWRYWMDKVEQFETRHKWLAVLL